MLKVDCPQKAQASIDAGSDIPGQGRHLEAVLAEASRLRKAGFKPVPLGGGSDGKVPSVKSAGRAALGATAFRRKLIEKETTMYGVRLDGIVVLDCDVHDDELVRILEERFGTAAVKVQSPRGMHLYYADIDRCYPDLKREGYPVDVKRGTNQYVVGSGSVRPDGGEYVAVLGSLGETALLPLRDSKRETFASDQSKQVTVFTSDGLVRVGSRHSHLKRRAAQLAASSETADELFRNLVFIRDENCQDPSSVSDDEVRNLAEWAFTRHQQGRLYGLAGGYVSVPHRMIDRLTAHPDALALYLRLLATHRCKEKAEFALSYDGMVANSLINMSRRAFRSAVDTLVTVGAISVAAEYIAGKRFRQYRLAPL